MLHLAPRTRTTGLQDYRTSNLTVVISFSPSQLSFSSSSSLSPRTLARSLDSTLNHTNVPGRPKKRTSTRTTRHRTSHCFPSIASCIPLPLAYFLPAFTSPASPASTKLQRLARTRNDQRFRFRHTTLLPLGPPYVCPLPRLNHLPLWLRPDRTSDQRSAVSRLEPALHSTLGSFSFDPHDRTPAPSPEPPAPSRCSTSPETRPDLST